MRWCSTFDCPPRTDRETTGQRAGTCHPAHAAPRTHPRKRSSDPPSTRRAAGIALRRSQCTALLRGAPRTDCAAQHAGAKRTCEPGLLGASNDNRSLEIATGASAHDNAASKTHRRMTQALHWGLTFDMSGRRRAQPFGCPLDGGVSPRVDRRHCPCGGSLKQPRSTGKQNRARPDSGLPCPRRTVHRQTN